MSLGKRLLLYSPTDPHARDLTARVQGWGCLTTPCKSVEELRGRIEGGDFDLVLTEGSASLRSMISEIDASGEGLLLPMAEVEKRHILRVVSYTGGNKTRAARILGIDTKTLYNKLKAYGVAASAFRRKTERPGMENTVQRPHHG